MPLAFSSISHGTVAFGFFNIATDMLLLEELFFFADRFCKALSEVAQLRPCDGGVAELPAVRIDDRARIGDLHSAIAGVDLSGFIGETYRHYPFPAELDRFKQDPEGSETQEEIWAMAKRYGVEVEATLRWQPAHRSAAVGRYLFDGEGIDALADYVARGGYPRWRDEQRPAYVQAMVSALADRTPWRRVPGSV